DASRQIAHFQKIADRHWRAEFPIEIDPQNSEKLTGIVYLFKGAVQSSMMTASAHYAAEYDLRIVDGHIAPDSELWMGYVLATGNIFVVPEGKIPEDEWFSFRPIPEIEGENSQDKDL